MTEVKLDLTKKYQTRDGRTVTNLRLSEIGVCIVGNVDCFEHYWLKNGRYTSREQHAFDLIEVKEEEQHKMTEVKLDLTKKYQTRGGRNVSDLVYYVGQYGEYIEGNVHNKTNESTLWYTTWNLNGKFYANNEESLHDLIEVKEDDINQPSQRDTIQHLIKCILKDVNNPEVVVENCLKILRDIETM